MLARISSKKVAGRDRDWNSAEWSFLFEAETAQRGFGTSASSREKRHCIVEESNEKGANFRACVNERMRCESIQTMNFLGPSNEIHSP